MPNLILFVAVSAGGGLLLWQTTVRSFSPAGLYRFLAFELLLALAWLTREHWFLYPLSVPQLISWLFWAAGLALALPALFRPLSDQSTGDLAGRDADAPLPMPPRRGIYKAVRHPFYAAALFTGWGFFAKSLASFDNASMLYACLLTGASLFLVSAARADEAADYARFGAAYALYIKASKMLIPFVW
jgi:protein-S-isoprenylcysteine O-methyltransferase Ste14